ncbi:hypothetical protein PISMIDRAFT_11541 [Pisolithus microcarpus 441]|uniref:Uncharacterized protein n=1 Tax=Pisolithus microcarpus 441 TaxID=765257 RepID=A0A0C9Z0I7_9AGAM|nr:hypothetical protein PISMIDRAFT_11541 [Pisolithus microcarpus 441]
MSFEDDPLAFYGRSITEDFRAFLTSKLPPRDHNEADLSSYKLRFLPDKKVDGDQITVKFLERQYVDMHVKDWSHDAQTMGEFPFFGPGDFQNTYTSLTCPAVDKCLHFAGDVISPNHPWVSKK